MVGIGLSAVPMLGIVVLGAGIGGGFLASLPGAIVCAVTGFGAEGLPPFSPGNGNIAAAAVIVPMITTFAKVGVKLVHTITSRALRLAFSGFLLQTSP